MCMAIPSEANPKPGSDNLKSTSPRLMGVFPVAQALDLMAY